MPSRTKRATCEARSRFWTWASLVSNFASSLASSWLSRRQVFLGHQLAADLVPVRGKGVGEPLGRLMGEHVTFAEVSGDLQGVQNRFRLRRSLP